MTVSSLVKSPGGNYQARNDSPALKVGDRVVIQPQNLSQRRQYLAHATGEITSITGTKASVMLDEPANKAYKSHTVKVDLCSLKLICAVEWEPVSPWEELLPEDFDSLVLPKSTNTAVISLPSDSQEFPTTATCDNSTNTFATSTPTSSPLPPTANPSQSKANDWEPLTSETVFQQSLRRSPNSNPNIGASKTFPDFLAVLSNQEPAGVPISEESLLILPTAGMMHSGYVLAQDTLAPPSVENGYCWLDSPGALSSKNSRSPGQSKLEAFLKKNGIINKGEVLNPVFLCNSYNLPPTFLDPSELRTAAQLLEAKEQQLEIFSTPELLPSPSSEYSTSTPSAPEKNTSESLLGDIDKSPSKRRQRGLGSGSIHWRTITKNGKDYPQAFYHWKENRQKKTKYIPKKLRLVIQEAEAAKRPVIEILGLLGVGVSPSKLLGDIEIRPSNSELLGDMEIRPSNSKLLGDMQVSPSNSQVLGDMQVNPSKEALEIDPSNEISPSKMRRHKGDGSGSIHWRIITKGGKDYPQAYYHYEFWNGGDRLVKSTKYIPKRLLTQVQQMEQQKAPVREILGVLGVKS